LLTSSDEPQIESQAIRPFRRFNFDPEVSRPVVLMYVRFPLSLRNVEDLLFERGIDLGHETIRFWWNRFGPMFAGDIRRKRVSHMRGFRHWRWPLDEMYVKLNGEMVCMTKALKRHAAPEAITTDGLRTYKAAMDELGSARKQEQGR
jgi:putative transposase